MVSNGQHMAVLIVEDDIAASTLIDRVMRSISQDVELDWTTSAEEAIEIIDTAHRLKIKRPYDLIVSDFYLDGSKNGLDFWNTCRDLFPDIPFVLMSSYEPDFFMQDDSGVLVPYFLKKPFNLRQCRDFFSGFFKNSQKPGLLNLK